MARFEVQRGVPFDHPERWEPLREAEASGDQAAPDAIDAVSEETGWYRARIADEDQAWVYCEVTLNPQTGAKQIRCPEAPPF